MKAIFVKKRPIKRFSNQSPSIKQRDYPAGIFTLRRQRTKVIRKDESKAVNTSTAAEYLLPNLYSIFYIKLIFGIEKKKKLSKNKACEHENVGL